MDNLMIHRCTIKSRIKSGEDSFGNSIWDWHSTQNVHCRFTLPKGHNPGTTVSLTSGEYVTRQPLLMLKQELTETDEITGTMGFEGEYTITKVYPRYDSTRIHHYEADLERKP